MKQFIMRTMLGLMMFMAACSNSQVTPQQQLATIDELLAKKYDMTEPQRIEIAEQVAKGKALLAEGKNAEAGTAFAKAIEVLQYAAEADRFNKSE